MICEVTQRDFINRVTGYDANIKVIFYTFAYK